MDSFGTLSRSFREFRNILEIFGFFFEGFRAFFETSKVFRELQRVLRDFLMFFEITKEFERVFDIC